MRIGLTIAAVGLLLVTGCATPAAGPAAATADTLALAFSARVDDLEARQATEPAAAYALSILSRYGLRDVPLEVARADELRQRALASQGATTITQYIPGIDGAPGSVHLIHVPNPGFSLLLAQVAERCAEALEAESRRSAPDNLHEVVLSPPSPAIEACGGEARYASLAPLWHQARPWGDRPLPNCRPDDARCQVLRRKVMRLNARDPAAEARAAAARGDFRLGAFNHIGPMPQGWRLPGVRCRAWSRDMIGKWHVNQDVIMPGDPEHSDAALGFIAAYNRNLVNDPAFPYPDVCAEAGVSVAERFTGPVTIWPEFARAGDPEGEAPTGRSVDEVDIFGRTAFEWASEADTAPMMMRLLAAGADPETVADARSPTPLALALERRQFDLAEALMSAGARMTGETRLCESPMYIMPGAPGPEGVCTWVGLLLARERPQWVERAVADGGGSGLWSAYFGAIEAGDDATARLLAPLMGGAGAAGALQRTWKLNRPDLALAMVTAGGHEAARSQTESRLWKAAADGGHAEALAFLYEFGADVNLLSPDRASACERSAAAGNVEALLACVTEAGRIRQRLTAQLAAGDIAGFRAGVAAVADVREGGKPTLVEMAAQQADAATVAMLIEQGAIVVSSRAFSDQGAEPARPYAGALRPQAETQAAASGYEATAGHLPWPLQLAVARGDAAMIRVLTDAGVRGLGNMAVFQGGMGGSPPGDSFSESTDTSLYPDAPGPEEMAALRLLIPEIARGPDAAEELENVFRAAVNQGYDDVMRLVIENGFDARTAENPARIWSGWASFGPCKPSTGRLLVQSGLDARYPADLPRYDALPQRTVASSCRNPDSAAVLVEAGLAPINEIDRHGRTALDIALDRHYRPQMQAALRALGGLPAVEVDPAGHAGRQEEARENDDLDLEQSERE